MGAVIAPRPSLASPLAAGARNPKLDSALDALVVGQLVAANRLAAADDAELQPHFRWLGDRVQVEIAVRPEDMAAARVAILAAGGMVTGTAFGDTTMQAWLPVTALEDVAAGAAVLQVRRPSELIPMEVAPASIAFSEGLAAMNALDWHAAGQRGAGARVGIIDGGFLGYRNIRGNELPGQIVVRNFTDGESDTEVDGGSHHGTACAEIVHDVAPDAELILAKVATAVDLEEAVVWLRDLQRVDVISTSIGFSGLGPGDGTGPLAELVAATRGAGVLWATAAGNHREQHWSGQYTDRNGDGLHDFVVDGVVNCAGVEEACSYLGPGVRLSARLRWNDWDRVDQDLDLVVVRWNGLLWVPIGVGGLSAQNGLVGQTPTEVVTATTSGLPTYYGVAIGRASGSRALHLDVFVESVSMLQQVAARSLTSPADSEAALTVAAVDVLPPYPQESYSSEGPTNGPGGSAGGGKPKPDIAAFANVSTASFGPDAFNGTSAATPHVAGAAALVRAAFPEWSVDEVESFLLGRAIDQGASGADSRFGHGRVFLGGLPPSPSPSASATPPRTPTRSLSRTATRTSHRPPPAVTLTATRSTTTTRSHTPRSTATPSVTNTPSGTQTRTSSSSPRATSTRGPCYGDCNRDGALSIAEILTAVNIALGLATADRCPELDPDGDGEVRVNDVVRAINSSLFGCVAPPTVLSTQTTRSTLTPSVTASSDTPMVPSATVTPTMSDTSTRSPSPTPSSTPQILSAFFHALVVNSESETVTVVDLEALEVVTTITGFAEPQAIVASLDGTRAFVSNRARDTVAIVDVLRNQVVDEVPVGPQPHALALSADGRWLAAATEKNGGTVVTFDATSMETVGEVHVGVRPVSLAFSPISAKLYAGAGGMITVVDFKRSAIIGEILLPDTSEATDLTFIPGGTRCFGVSRADNRMFVIDAESDALTGDLALGVSEGGAMGIGDLPYTTLLMATQSVGRELTLVDRDTMAVIARVPTTGTPVDVVARDSFFAFVPLQDPTGGAGQLAVVNAVTRVVQTTIGPLGIGPSDIALVDYRPPDERATRTPTRTPTPVCPPALDEVSRTLSSTGSLTATEYELEALRATVRVTDARQHPELRITLAAENCGSGGEVRARTLLEGYGSASAVVSVPRAGVCPSTYAATAIFDLSDLPVGDYPVKVFVAGDRPFGGAQLEFGAEPPREVAQRVTTSSVSHSGGGEVEIPDLRVDLVPGHACDSYEVRLGIRSTGSGNSPSFTVRIEADWSADVVAGPFEPGTNKFTEVVATFIRASAGPHTIQIFVNQGGSGPNFYSAELKLFSMHN